MHFDPSFSVLYGLYGKKLIAKSNFCPFLDQRDFKVRIQEYLRKRLFHF